VFEMLDPLVNIRDSMEDTATPVPCKTAVAEHRRRNIAHGITVHCWGGEIAHIGLAHTCLGK